MTDHPRTRSTDNTADARAVQSMRAESRRRTVVMSIIGASIIALFFGWANDIDQRKRSIENCELVQEDRRLEYRQLKLSADQILGSEDGKIKPFDFTDSGFEKFKPLIVVQAAQERKDAKAIRQRLENCNEVHPYPNPIPFM